MAFRWRLGRFAKRKICLIALAILAVTMLTLPVPVRQQKIVRASRRGHASIKTLALETKHAAALIWVNLSEKILAMVRKLVTALVALTLVFTLVLEKWLAKAVLAIFETTRVSATPGTTTAHEPALEQGVISTKTPAMETRLARMSMVQSERMLVTVIILVLRPQATLILFRATGKCL